MCRSYYRGADAIVFVYDVTNSTSFENISFWINELEAACQMDGMPWNTTLTGDRSDSHLEYQCNYHPDLVNQNKNAYDCGNVW